MRTDSISKMALISLLSSEYCCSKMAKVAQIHSKMSKLKIVSKPNQPTGISYGTFYLIKALL
jgi:hypothetical protein